VPSGTVFTDSISGIPAVVRSGTAANLLASLSGTGLTLPGATTGNQTAANLSAYLDLPNGLVSSKPNLTVESWITPLSSQSWQRLFDFGRTNVTLGPGAATGEIIDTTTAPGATTGWDNLVLSLNNGTTLGSHRAEGRLGNAATIFTDTNLNASTSSGTEYHYVLTVTDGAGTSGPNGCQVRFYRNGTLHSTTSLNFRLSQISDVNNWIGRSQYGNDRCSNMRVNELRFYNHALSAAEITASYTAGPNPSFVPPVAVNDTVTMHRNQKARIAVTANDTGPLSSSTVAIVQPPQFGSATVDPSGKILYTHTTGAPAGDAIVYQASGPGGVSSPATVSITFSDQLRIANSALAVPASPPPVSIQAVNAFPGLTFSLPTCMASPPGDNKRLFVCTKGGVLSVIPDVTAAAPSSSTVLTLSAAAGGLFNGRTPAESLSTNSEQGLLGLAFHPDFASNGHVFIFYSVNIGGVVYERVSRLTLNNPASAAPTAVLSSELVLIQQLDEAGNHNGGDLHFGPDGYLYISLGDEGDQNDQRFNAQRIDKDFFSGILRIDVNLEGSEIAGNPAAADDSNLPPNSHPAIPLYGGLPAYEVPADNPFVGASTFNGLAVVAASVRSEFWAVGLRNPWRMSFDGTDLWVGDVGGNLREEINLVTRGGNYGWVYREGTTTGPWASSSPSHPAPPAGFVSTDPLYEYPHGSGSFQGNSVTGGIVYRGSRVPSLTGAYIFADYSPGNVWSLVRNGANPPTVTRLLGEGGIVAFARDPSNGDVLMADHGDNLIRRITTVTDTSTYPATLSATGLFADLTDLSPSPGLLPYTINLPFWSDHAIKRRWFAIPDALSQMTWSRDGEWTFPAGQVWVKHFDIETTRGNPATRKRLETRLLVKNAAGAYGVSYRWNEAGTEASLVADAGEDFNLNLTVDGSPYTQRWRIPSRSECMVCHTPQAGFALSSNTRQFNLSGNIHGFSGNQIDLLKNAGYFSNSPDSPNLLPRHLRPDETTYPAEARVRSYLAVNCSYCHKTGGTASPAAWDGRHELTLDQTGLVNGPATNNGGDPLNKLVVPGDSARSVVLNRIAAANGFTRMPPLGSNELDQANIALLTEWINGSLPARQSYDDWRLAEFLSGTSPAGAPGEDPDGDGRSNRNEFLAGTDPLSGGSFLAPLVATGPAEVTLSFTLPPNRSGIIEHSENLGSWQPWDVPGNHGLPSPGGVTTLSGPRQAAAGFFRLRMKEN
jgi:uncharacterized repeat protein (TIGR03806 family)